MHCASWNIDKSLHGVWMCLNPFILVRYFSILDTGILFIPIRPVHMVAIRKMVTFCELEWQCLLSNDNKCVVLRTSSIEFDCICVIRAGTANLRLCFITCEIPIYIGVSHCYLNIARGPFGWFEKEYITCTCVFASWLLNLRYVDIAVSFASMLISHQGKIIM